MTNSVRALAHRAGNQHRYSYTFCDSIVYPSRLHGNKAFFLGAPEPTHRQHHHDLLIAASSKDGESGNLGDDLLDFMYAGKKLRKWYGQEGQVLPQDGANGATQSKQLEEEQQGYNAGPRDEILVVEADTVPMAEQVLLQLILARAKVKALVKDKATAEAGFGPYVQSIAGSINDALIIRKACRRVKSAVVCGEVTPSLISSLTDAQVPHLVLLSAVGAPSPTGFTALFGTSRETKLLEDPKREDLVKKSGLDYSIIRVVGKLEDSQGGITQLKLLVNTKNPSTSSTSKVPALSGPVAREDAALVLAQAATREEGSEERGGGGIRIECTLFPDGPGVPPSDWNAVFRDLISLKPHQGSGTNDGMSSSQPTTIA